MVMTKALHSGASVSFFTATVELDHGWPTGYSACLRLGGHIQVHVPPHTQHESLGNCLFSTFASFSTCKLGILALPCLPGLL